MSPTATIASVVIALLFCAWLFQSDLKDPGYEAWLKRQQDEKKSDTAQKASMGINVTDAGVTKDSSTLESHRAMKGSGGSAGDADLVLSAADNSMPIENSDLKNDDANRKEANKTGFPNGSRIDGMFVGVTYVGDAPKLADLAQSPSIVFRRDGNFYTQNMGKADVDMEPAAGGAVDRGMGRYKLSGNTLDLTYSDGLTRTKGNRRTYFVVCVTGVESAPTAITIQGKVFKLSPEH